MANKKSNKFSGKISGIFTVSDGRVNRGVNTNKLVTGDGTPCSFTFNGSNFTSDISLGLGFEYDASNVLIPFSSYTYGSQSAARSPYFSMGQLLYFNGSNATDGAAASGITLTLKVQLTAPLKTQSEPKESFSFNLAVDNTPSPGAPDSVAFLSNSTVPVALKTDTGKRLPLILHADGFGSIIDSGLTESSIERISKKYVVGEGKSAQADIIGHFENPTRSIIEGAVKPLRTNRHDFDIGLFPPSFSYKYTTATATFTPNFNLTLKEAANLCGFDHFNWYQVITKDPYPLISKKTGESLTPPYVDPPIGGAKENNKPGGDDDLPFYYDEPLGKSSITNEEKTLSFVDTPIDDRLKGEQYIEYQTSLVGVFPDGKTFQVLYTFNWKTNYDGKNGGVIPSSGTKRNNISENISNTSNGVFDFNLNLTPADIPALVRRRMESDGAQNASGATATPPTPIKFKGNVRGRNIKGKDRSEVLEGTDKNDLINGKKGSDRISGNKGDDNILGGEGRDRLIGGDGNDVLVGDAGKDILTGGKGRDLFTFSTLGDVDKIVDFSIKDDLIDLTKFFASPSFANIDIFSQFTDFLQVVATRAGTQIKVDADGAGIGTTFTPLVTLKGVSSSSLASGSFVIG